MDYSVLVIDDEVELAFFAVIGFLLGGTVGLVTILMVFTIGPMVAWTGKKIKRFLE